MMVMPSLCRRRDSCEEAAGGWVSAGRGDSSVSEETYQSRGIHGLRQGGQLELRWSVEAQGTDARFVEH